MLWVVVGKSGLFGSDLVKDLSALGERTLVMGRPSLDLDSSLEELVEIFGTEGDVSYIVNTIGYTAVDRAELEPEQANLINVDYTRKLATIAEMLGSRFIHISTDYVFDGLSETPYKTADSPRPTTAYGRSKRFGEIAAEESCSDLQIFRTAWLYGANGNCFPKIVAKTLLEKGEIRVVSDQIGQPTWTHDLSRLIIAHQEPGVKVRPRIVHATASGSCSWYDFACEIAVSLGRDPKRAVIPIPSSEYPTAAQRPSFSVLDNQNETGLAIGDWRERWREAAPLVLAEYLQ